jgi:putative transposase
MVTGRRERRMAARLAAEYAALAVPEAAEAESPGPQPRAAGEAEGDDDDADEIFDAPGDFYADAFEVLE